MFVFEACLVYFVLQIYFYIFTYYYSFLHKGWLKGALDRNISMLPLSFIFFSFLLLLAKIILILIYLQFFCFLIISAKIIITYKKNKIISLKSVIKLFTILQGSLWLAFSQTIFFANFFFVTFFDKFLWLSSCSKFTKKSVGREYRKAN